MSRWFRCKILESKLLSTSHIIVLTGRCTLNIEQRRFISKEIGDDCQCQFFQFFDCWEYVETINLKKINEMSIKLSNSENMYQKIINTWLNIVDMKKNHILAYTNYMPIKILRMCFLALTATLVGTLEAHL